MRQLNGRDPLLCADRCDDDMDFFLTLKQGSHVQRSAAGAVECADYILSVDGIIVEQR